MAIEWTKNIAVGIELIDEQHKVLFQKVDDLFEACRLGKGREVIGGMLTFLKGYTEEHFYDEETYMQRINYPEYAKQKEMHTQFINELNRINNEYIAGNNLIVTISINDMIIKWLTHHISIEDKKIGEYMKNYKI